MLDRFYCELEILVKCAANGREAFNSYPVSRNRNVDRVRAFLANYNGIRYAVIYRRHNKARAEQIGYYSRKTGLQVTNAYLDSLN